MILLICLHLNGAIGTERRTVCHLTNGYGLNQVRPQAVVRPQVVVRPQAVVRPQG